MTVEVTPSGRVIIRRTAAMKMPARTLVFLLTCVIGGVAQPVTAASVSAPIWTVFTSDNSELTSPNAHVRSSVNTTPTLSWKIRHILRL
jgi:hypothetical protein